MIYESLVSIQTPSPKTHTHTHVGSGIPLDNMRPLYVFFFFYCVSDVNMAPPQKPLKEGVCVFFHSSVYVFILHHWDDLQCCVEHETHLTFASHSTMPLGKRFVDW